MSEQITTALVKGFSQNFKLLSQQKVSRLRRSVYEQDITGEDHFIDQIGSSDGHDITDRHGDTQYAGTPHARRRVRPVPWEWAELIDNPDKVRMLADPTSAYVKAAVASANRRMDKHIIDCGFGTAYTGKTGSTPVTFPAGNVVAVDFQETGAVGITIKKLLEAKRILWGYDIDEDIPVHCAMAAHQFVELLQKTEVASAEYNTVRALAEGTVNSYMGIEFHRSEKLLVDSNSYRRVMVWAQDGIGLGVHVDVKTHIDILPQKRHSTQVRIEMDLGASRLEEEKVVEIKCSEA